MITYKTGNILDARTSALVNTVNTVGVMGKGIALQFKNAFPENFKAYAEAVKRGEIRTGEVQVVPVSSLGGVRYIVSDRKPLFF
jgi:O-acetyl-ADP-ribose deacetylase (regulator of RNase III)